MCGVCGVSLCFFSFPCVFFFLKCQLFCLSLLCLPRCQTGKFDAFLRSPMNYEQLVDILLQPEEAEKHYSLHIQCVCMQCRSFVVRSLVFSQSLAVFFFFFFFFFLCCCCCCCCCLHKAKANIIIKAPCMTTTSITEALSCVMRLSMLSMACACTRATTSQVLAILEVCVWR